MSNKVLRQVLRWGHMVVGALMIAFVYSATLRSLDGYVALMQFVVVPAVMVSGVVMWQQARLGKLLQSLRGGAQKMDVQI